MAFRSVSAPFHATTCTPVSIAISIAASDSTRMSALGCLCVVLYSLPLCLPLRCVEPGCCNCLLCCAPCWLYTHSPVLYGRYISLISMLPDAKQLDAVTTLQLAATDTDPLIADGWKHIYICISSSGPDHCAGAACNACLLETTPHLQPL